jgi:anaerobic magnesium-protoporphyrin IX monomethyl ester cyclase
MKILLVTAKQYQEKAYYINLGIATIGAIVRNSGHSVSAMDFDSFKYREEEPVCNVDDVDVVLVSGMITNLKNICDAVKLVKSKLPNATYVLGGGCPSTAPLQVLEYLDQWFDYFVVEEGDNLILPLLEIIEKIRNGSAVSPLINMVNTLQFHEGKLIGQRSKANPPEIATVPMPAYDLFDMETYLETTRTLNRSFEMYTSKGCPWECTFCYKISGTTVRFRNVENIIAEMDYLNDNYGITQFSMEDDAFGFNKEWLKGFCAATKKKGYGFRFQSIINSLRSREKMEMMLDSGLTGISMGIESGSEDTLSKLAKQNDLGLARELIKFCNDNNLHVSGGFILGTPGETWEDIEETKRFLVENRMDEFQIFFLNPYPGTPLWDKAVADKKVSSNVVEHFLSCKFQDEVYINLTEFSDQELYDMRTYIVESVAKAHNKPVLTPLAWKRDAEALNALSD